MEVIYGFNNTSERRCELNVGSGVASVRLEVLRFAKERRITYKISLTLLIPDSNDTESKWRLLLKLL